VQEIIRPSSSRPNVSFINMIMASEVYKRVSSRSSDARNFCLHWRREGAADNKKCSLVSRGAAHAGQHGEYFESFRLALTPTGRWRWVYFGTKRELDVENRAEPNAGQLAESYVAASQSLRSRRYCDSPGAVAEYLRLGLCVILSLRRLLNLEMPVYMYVVPRASKSLKINVI
jgi:hypothetical protein